MKIDRIVKVFVMLLVLFVAVVVGGHLWILRHVSVVEGEGLSGLIAGALLHQKLHAFHLLSLGVSVLLLLALLWYLTRNVSGPLTELASLVRKAGLGNFDVEIPLELSSADNEIGDLARAFAEMISNLRKNKK